MRRLFTYLLILAAAVLAALYLNQLDGQVNFAIGPWRLEMSLLFFAVLLGLVVLVLYLLLVLLGRVLALPRRLQSWQGQRRQEAARSDLSSGLLHFAEGEYELAEQELVRSARRSDAPLINYMTAAMAAQRQGSQEKRDTHLSTAEETGPDANLPVRLLQAQLQAESGQWEQAQASVAAILEKEPKHRRALELMVACCRALGDWERLAPLLSRIERQGVLPKGELQELNRWVARERLARAAGQGREALTDTWQSLSRGWRKDPEVIGAYADALVAAGDSATAEELLQKQLQKEWHPGLLRRYAWLPAMDAEEHQRRLERVEAWIAGHEDDPQALYAAGILAAQAGQWDRARKYLEDTVERSADPEYLRALAALQEQQGDYEAARLTYRRLAVDLSAGGSAGLPGALGLPEPGGEGRAEGPDVAEDSLEHWRPEDEDVSRAQEGEDEGPGQRPSA